MGNCEKIARRENTLSLANYLWRKQSLCLSFPSRAVRDQSAKISGQKRASARQPFCISIQGALAADCDSFAPITKFAQPAGLMGPPGPVTKDTHTLFYANYMRARKTTLCSSRLNFLHNSFLIFLVRTRVVNSRSFFRSTYLGDFSGQS